MENNGANGKTEEIPDDLQGLMQQCPRCKDARAALGELNKRLAGFVLIGTVLDEEHDSDLNKREQRLWGPFYVECDQCMGMGITLQPEGRRLMGLIKSFLSQAHEDWIKTPNDKIPF